MPTARVDTILYMADRNDSRKITRLMNACCKFFSWPKFLMRGCDSNPFLNKGTCVDQVNGFDCSCPPGFSGKRYEMG